MNQQYIQFIFIDLEKACNRGPIEILWKSIVKTEVRIAYVGAIKDMYNRVLTTAQTQGVELEHSPITIRLHKNLAQIYILFV